MNLLGIMEIIDNGATLTLNNLHYESNRTIHMETVPDNDSQPLTRLGFSRGQWETPNILVIETDHITAPAFSGNGHLQSEQMQIVERFTLSDDQCRLDYRMVMTDPVALSDPAVLALDRQQEDSQGASNRD